MDPPLSIGDWLQRRRKALGLTREQLAQRVGYSVSSLRKIEAGERRPSSQVAELLANGLELPPEARPTFLKVARGVLSVERLPPPAPLITPSAQVAPLARPTEQRLPVNPTPLIGRQRELAELAQLLADPACRLITLVGPGGIGKTRLAIRAARQAADTFADGAAFVPLAPLTSLRFVAPAVASAVGFTFAGPAGAERQVLDYLCPKHLLLVMDNAEHLLADGAAELLARLLQCAAGVKLLVTSREVLQLEGEWVFEVHGLPVREGSPAGAEGEDGAVELFVQRARRAHVGWAPMGEDYAAILRICQLVEGMPLAIELAAAWARVLACPEIAAEIERNPERLASAARDVPARHRSLGAVVEHSWVLLSDDERLALMKLSMFRGGFTREAAQRVAEADLAQLSALMTKSLIQRRDSRHYGLHELVRQHGAARLQADAEALDATRERHGRYFIDQLLQAEVALKSDRQAVALDQLSQDIDNCRVAWEWAVERQHVGDLPEVGFVLLYFYELRGLYEEGEAVFRYAAEHLRSDPVARDTTAGAVALWAMVANQGYFARRRGLYAESYVLLQESVAQLRRYGDRQVLRFALRYCGVACMAVGRFTEANACLQESLALSEAASQSWGVAITSIYLGIVAYEHDEIATAARHLRQGLDISRRLGDPRLIAYSLAYLGQAALDRGALDEARLNFGEGLSLARETGDRYNIGLALVGLGRAALMSGQANEAQLRLQASQALFAEISEPDQLAQANINLGDLALACGDLEDARRSFVLVVRLGMAGKAPLRWAAALIGLARVNLRTDPQAPAPRERALGLALLLDQPERNRQCRQRAQALRAEMESLLTPERMEAVRQQARGQSLEAFAAALLEAGIAPD